MTRIEISDGNGIIDLSEDDHETVSAMLSSDGLHELPRGLSPKDLKRNARILAKRRKELKASSPPEGQKGQ